MKKVFKLEELDCPVCASKMEEGIKKLNGVKSASVSFIQQQLVLEAEEAEFEKVLKETVKLCKKIEPDCEIVL